MLKEENKAEDYYNFFDKECYEDIKSILEKTDLEEVRKNILNGFKNTNEKSNEMSTGLACITDKVNANIKEECHENVKNVPEKIDLEEAKKNILENLKKINEKANEAITSLACTTDKEDDKIKKENEIVIPPIVRDVGTYLRNFISENIELELYEYKTKEYIRYNCFDKEADIFSTLQIKEIMVLTYLPNKKENDIMKKNQDIDMFILLHNKKFSILDYVSKESDINNYAILNNLVLEWVDTRLEEMWIINNPYHFFVDKFFNSEIILNKSENMETSIDKMSEIEKLLKHSGYLP